VVLGRKKEEEVLAAHRIATEKGSIRDTVEIGKVVEEV